MSSIHIQLYRVELCNRDLDSHEFLLGDLKLRLSYRNCFWCCCCRPRWVPVTVTASHPRSFKWLPTKLTLAKIMLLLLLLMA